MITAYGIAYRHLPGRKARTVLTAVLSAQVVVMALAGIPATESLCGPRAAWEAGR